LIAVDSFSILDEWQKPYCFLQKPRDGLPGNLQNRSRSAYEPDKPKVSMGLYAANKKWCRI
jgi:hypothetical protein